MQRRTFLSASAGLTALPFVLPAAAQGANERVTLGVIGARGRGRDLAQGFAKLPNARVKWLCDVDSNVFPAVAKPVEASQGLPAQTAEDFRKVLEDREVDAVVVATPDHWHALITLHALAAGKDVYVEKPCSHTIAEGAAMMAAVRKTGRVVQVGTQRRSSPDFQKAMEVLRSGRLGKLHLAKALNSQRRADIGRKPDGPVPSGVNYDLWLGPAPQRAFNPNRFHYQWHWFWEYGTGDLGNDGVHHVDVARWGLQAGQPAILPKRVTSAGGKLFFQDDQETPDTQTVVYDYGDRHLLYEMRLWSPYGEHGMENGNVFYGEDAYMVLGDGGYRIHEKGDRDGTKPAETVKFTTRGDREHLENFLQCVKERKTPNCPIAEGHLSAALCHLGNISHRVGRALDVETERGGLKGDAQATALLHRQYRKGWELPVV